MHIRRLRPFRRKLIAHRFENLRPPSDPPTSDGYRFFLDVGPLSNADARYSHGDVPEWIRMMQPDTYDGESGNSFSKPPGTSGPSADMSGFQELVRGDVMRGKFRRSFSTPVPMVPTEPTSVDFTRPDVYHTFEKGHRIMVQVQRSWFPLVDRNPKRFVDICAAKAADFQKATQRVFHALDHASRIEIRVLPSGG